MTLGNGMNQKPMAFQPKLVPLPGQGPAIIADGKIQTDMGLFDVVKWSGENTSGFVAMGDNVLVLPYQPSATTGSGLIQLPPDVLERLAFAAELGVIVDMGEGAFVFARDRLTKWAGKKFEIGDHVYFERYAGGQVRGADMNFYRCMSDKSVALKCT